MTTFQSIQLNLAGHRVGRLTLHLICLCQDGKIQWHGRGMIREFPRTERLAQFLRSQWVRWTRSDFGVFSPAQCARAMRHPVLPTTSAKCAA